MGVSTMNVRMVEVDIPIFSDANEKDVETPVRSLVESLTYQYPLLDLLVLLLHKLSSPQ